VLSTGQSLGERQSNGPHSSTMIADRSRSVRGDDGTAVMRLHTPSGATAFAALNAFGDMRTPLVSRNDTAESVEATELLLIVRSRVFAALTATRCRANAFPSIVTVRLCVSRRLGYSQSLGSTRFAQS